MKIVIIEDEKAAVRNLTSLLNEIKPNGEIVTILDSISSTIEWFSSHPMPELVFMQGRRIIFFTILQLVFYFYIIDY